jgi:monofunctional glycosyltransferase
VERSAAAGCPLKKVRGRRRWRWLTWLTLAGVAVSVVLVAVFRFVDPPTTAFMERREAQAAAQHDDRFILKHRWVPLEKVSRELQVAVLAAEDQKFVDHRGFDVQAIEDALEDRLEGKSTRGASTLTQQLAKNLFLWPGQSWLRKALEVYFTALLELLWSKRRILEVYLNVAEFGDGVYGVEAACRINFGHGAASASAREAAALAVVLPNPHVRKVNALSPKVQQRAEWVSEQARRLGFEVLKQL